jgi:hypothetical protein
MNQALLILGLVSSAAALTLDVASEDASETTGNCKDGVWRWQKRNSSALREKPQPVKKIYFINVDGQDGRKRHMMAELKQKAHSTPYERFPAFSAAKVPKKEGSEHFKKVASLYSKARYTPWLLKDSSKEVFAAIHISNYQVMERILKEDPLGDKSDSVYMILEDDSSLDSQWQHKLERILENTPAEWDLLRIGYWGAARCGDRENNYVFAIQPPAKDVKALGDGHFYSGNTGYVVRPKSIPRILDIMRNSSFASIENVLMYPHRFPDKSDHQVLSYAVAPDHMLVHPSGSFESSHTR